MWLGIAALERMSEERRERQERCEEVAAGLNGKKAAILRKARETKKEAQEMAKTTWAPTPTRSTGSSS